MGRNTWRGTQETCRHLPQFISENKVKDINYQAYGSQNIHDNKGTEDQRQNPNGADSTGCL